MSHLGNWQLYNDLEICQAYHNLWLNRLLRVLLSQQIITWAIKPNQTIPSVLRWLCFIFFSLLKYLLQSNLKGIVHQKWIFCPHLMIFLNSVFLYNVRGVQWIWKYLLLCFTEEKHSERNDTSHNYTVKKDFLKVINKTEVYFTSKYSFSPHFLCLIQCDSL